MRELAFFTEDLLSGQGITHWLDFGSLLGAVREQAFIAWDEDVDFGILARDVEAIRELEPQIAQAGFHLALDRAPVLRITYSAVNMQPLDLFVWAESGGWLESDAGDQYDWPGMHNRTSFPRSYLDETATVHLYGRPFPAPSPVHQFLVEHRYGPDYMTPTRLWVESAPDISPEQLTPRVKDLLADVDEAKRRLAQLSRTSRLSRFEAWRRWIDTGLPAAPGARFVHEVSAQIPPAERTPTVDALIDVLASVNHAIDDFERPHGRWRVRASHRANRARAFVRQRRPAAGS
jgi:hypothetical protein